MEFEESWDMPTIMEKRLGYSDETFLINSILKGNVSGPFLMRICFLTVSETGAWPKMTFRCIIDPSPSFDLI